MIWTHERREIALATCRKWQSTPHRDNMAELGVGIGCMHLIAEILKDSGVLPDFKVPTYDPKAGMWRESNVLKESVLACMDCHDVLDISAPEFGDIVIFQTDGWSGHCAFYTDKEIWHSLAKNCVTVSAYRRWLPRVDSLLRIASEGFIHQPKEVAA